VAGADRKAVGRVRLSTTETLATRFLAPHLARFHERHPQLTLELHCTMRAVSLGQREADVVVRLAQPREPDVVVRKLARIELALYGARRYLAAHPAPRAPDETLAGHRVVMFADAPAFAVENAWLEPRVAGAAVVLRSDSVSSIYSAVAAGAGLGLLPRRVADHDAELLRLPTDTMPEPRTVWQGVHRDLARSARVRAVLDFVGEVVSREA
jgi:DNA-binding transcriptional LysR family regulator